MANRIMFIIDVDDEESKRKWDELVKEHPGWNFHDKGEDGKPVVQRIIPNMTFECAEQIDEWLKEKKIERTWLKDDEPDYYRILRKYGWPY